MKTCDIVILNAKVHSMDSKNSVYDFIGIKGKKIVYLENLNSRDDIDKIKEYINGYIGKGTKVIDANENIVLPGFIDSHIHPPGTAITDLYEVSLYGLSSIKEYKESIKDFINKNPNAKAIYGKGWSLGVFDGEELSKGPKKEHLDEISTDLPIILRAYDGHTIWLNSKAFEVFNINEETEPPVGGKIELNEETNKVWGTLKEGATHLVGDFKYSDEQYVKAFELFQENMHKYGITSIHSISGLNWGIQPKHYEKLYKDNKLKLRVSNGIMIYSYEDYEEQINKIIEIRDKYKSDYFKTTTVKLLGDGVVEGNTANLLLPYEVGAGKGENYYGEFLWEEETLKNVIKKANKNKFSIHVHSVGDGSTNKMLNAIEELHKLNPTLYKNSRNSLTHLQLVTKDDIKRFNELDVIASVQPYWHLKGPGWWDVVDYKLLGERAKDEYPLKSFVDNNVLLVSSSDHSVTPIPNPMFAIEAGVTRNLYNAKYFGVDDIESMDDDRYLLNKNERISVFDMVKSFTINNAYTIFRENETGSIEVGKYADLIMVDRDIFNINPIDIEKAEVITTIFDGEIVYSKKVSID